MIPHAEFERAINQWKIRQQGGQVVSQVENAPSGAVMNEMPTANAEPAAMSVEMSSAETTEGTLDDEGGFYSDMRRSDFDPE